MSGVPAGGLEHMHPLNPAQACATRSPPASTPASSPLLAHPSSTSSTAWTRAMVGGRIWKGGAGRRDLYHFSADFACCVPQPPFASLPFALSALVATLAGGYCGVDPPVCDPDLGCRFLHPEPAFFTNESAVSFAFSAFQSPRECQQPTSQGGHAVCASQACRPACQKACRVGWKGWRHGSRAEQSHLRRESGGPGSKWLLEEALLLLA
jgi:hypothetical protein